MSNLTDGTTQCASVKALDLSEVLDSISFTQNTKPISHGLATATARSGLFSVTKWGALITELIAYPNQKAEVLEHFGITEYQLAELQDNSLFQAMYKDVQSSITSLASNGGFQLNARRLAEQSMTVLEDVLANGDDNMRVKAAEMIARWANLDPLVQAKLSKGEATVNTGVQLVVNFSENMPVPAAFKGQSVVIDTTSEVVDETE